MMYVAIYVAVMVSLLLFIPFIRGLYPNINDRRITGPYKNIPGILDDLFNTSKFYFYPGFEWTMIFWPAVLVFCFIFFLFWLLCNAVLMIVFAITWPFEKLSSLFKIVEELGEKVRKMK